MKKIALLFVLAGCQDPVPPPPPPLVVARPASLPASQPASLPAKASLTVDEGPRVLALQGDVQIDGKPAVVGTPVTRTSTVQTGDGAWARITLMPHNVLAVRPNSKFTLGTSVRKQWSVKLALGALWSFLPKGSSYEVETSNAVAGVRGTTLYVGAAGEGKTGVCACDGEVELTAGAKKKMVKSNHQHIGTVIAGNGGKAKLGKQQASKTPPGHDDVEAAELEKLRESIDR
jgi:hypothetical protein